MTAIRLKQDRTRRSGHAHSRFAQDTPQRPATAAENRQALAQQARWLLWLMTRYGLPEAQATVAAKAALRNLIEWAEREREGAK